jgi:hypothetical protein
MRALGHGNQISQIPGVHEIRPPPAPASGAYARKNGA